MAPNRNTAYIQRVTSVWEERMHFDSLDLRYEQSSGIVDQAAQLAIFAAGGAVATGMISTLYNALPIADISRPVATAVGVVAGSLLALVLQSAEPSPADRIARRRVEDLIQQSHF